MANLRKRVAACDLTRKRPTPEDQNANEQESEQLDNRPLLPKVCWPFVWCTYTRRQIRAIPAVSGYNKLRIHFDVKKRYTSLILVRPIVGRAIYQNQQAITNFKYVH